MFHIPSYVLKTRHTIADVSTNTEIYGCKDKMVANDSTTHQCHLYPIASKNNEGEIHISPASSSLVQSNIKCDRAGVRNRRKYKSSIVKSSRSQDNDDTKDVRSLFSKIQNDFKRDKEFPKKVPIALMSHDIATDRVVDNNCTKIASLSSEKDNICEGEELKTFTENDINRIIEKFLASESLKLIDSDIEVDHDKISKTNDIQKVVLIPTIDTMAEQSEENLSDKYTMNTLTGFNSCKEGTDIMDRFRKSTREFTTDPSYRDTRKRGKSLNSKPSSRSAKDHIAYNSDADVKDLSLLDYQYVNNIIETSSKLSLSHYTTIGSDAFEVSSSSRRAIDTPYNMRKNRQDVAWSIYGYNIMKHDTYASDEQFSTDFIDPFIQDYRTTLAKQSRDVQVKKELPKLNRKGGTRALRRKVKNNNNKDKNVSEASSRSEDTQDNLGQYIVVNINSDDAFAPPIKESNLSYETERTETDDESMEKNSSPTNAQGITETSTRKQSNEESRKISIFETEKEDENGKYRNSIHSDKTIGDEPSISSIETEKMTPQKNSREGSSKMSKDETEKKTQSRTSRTNSLYNEDASSTHSENRNKKESEQISKASSKRTSESERGSEGTRCPRVFRRDGDEFKCIDEELEQMLEESTKKSRKSSNSTEEDQCPVCDTGNDEVKNMAELLRDMNQIHGICVGGLPAVLGDLLWDQVDNGGNKSQDVQNNDDQNNDDQYDENVKSVTTI